MHKKKTVFLRAQREEMIRRGKTVLSSAELKKLFPNMRVAVTTEHFIVTHSEKSNRYTPMTFGFACQNPLQTDESGKHLNPITYVSADEVGEIFGIDFGGNAAEVMIGLFRSDLIEQTKLFVPAASRIQCLEMPNILVRVRCTRDNPGKEASLAKALGAQLFESRTNNSGHGGVDYWILRFDQAQANPQQIWEFRIRCAEQAYPFIKYTFQDPYGNCSY